MAGDNDELTQLRQEVEALRAIIAQHALNDQRAADESRRIAEAEAAAEQHRLDAERAAAERRRREDEADALLIVNLHAQAVALTTIKALVPMVLEVGSTSYPKWRGLHLITLGKYALTDHVLSDDVHPDVAPWHRMDCVVVSWIFGTISANLLEIVMTSSDPNHQPTSRAVWLALDDMFLGNKETRALLLDTEFRTFAQGALSISDYCRRLKSMADQLGSLGETVPDRTLVLATLRGLNDRYEHVTSFTKRQTPLPTFNKVRNDLLLEELTLNDKAASQSTALLSTGVRSSAGSPPSGGAPNPPGTTRGPTPGGGGNLTAGGNRQNTRRRRNKNGGGGDRAQQGGWPPSFFNPWTGTVQVWPARAPRPGPGSSVPRPPFQQGQPTPQAFTAFPAGCGPSPGGVGPLYGAPYPPGIQGYPMGAPGLPQQPPGLPQHPAQFTSGQGEWDQASLASAFSTMQLTPPPSTTWYMDSGASNHLTSDAGPSHQERDSQIQ